MSFVWFWRGERERTMSFISGSVLIDSGHVEGSESCIPRRKFGIEAG
jgi:hypothetical protein